MKWQAPLTADSLCDALEYAESHGKLHRNGIRAFGVVINHSPEDPEVEHLVTGLNKVIKASGPRHGLSVFRGNVYNGKPKGWWSLAFLWP